MDDYKKLKNQPLQFVLAEFRFSTVLDIQKYIPRLQEALRGKYPVSEIKNEQAIHVQPGGINVSTLERWSFLSANKKSAVDINQDRLMYCTSEYPRFKGFHEECQHALNILKDIVSPGLILRIGLRYGDLVKIEGNEKVADLVDSHFSFPNCVDQIGTAQHHRSETFLLTTLGGLSIRTLYGEHSLSCLPDIQDLPIELDIDEEPSERIVLDFDHFWDPRNESFSFETDAILSNLESLHETSREAFWNVTTDYARNTKWA